jgi:hypothetical protein
MLATPGTIMGRSGDYEYVDTRSIVMVVRYEVDECGQWKQQRKPLSRKVFMQLCRVRPGGVAQSGAAKSGMSHPLLTRRRSAPAVVAKASKHQPRKRLQPVDERAETTQDVTASAPTTRRELKTRRQTDTTADFYGEPTTGTSSSAAQASAVIRESANRVPATAIERLQACVRRKLARRQLMQALQQDGDRLLACPGTANTRTSRIQI